MFLPYLFVPAGRSCFWLPKLIGVIVHPVNQKMQVGDLPCVINWSVLWFNILVRIYLHVYGHRVAVEFHRPLATHESQRPSPACWLCCKTWLKTNFILYIWLTQNVVLQLGFLTGFLFKCSRQKCHWTSEREGVICCSSNRSTSFRQLMRWHDLRF